MVLNNILEGKEGWRADELKAGDVAKLINEHIGLYWVKRYVAGVDDVTESFRGTSTFKPETVSGYIQE
jgi:hypothetical protein